MISPTKGLHDTRRKHRQPNADLQRAVFYDTYTTSTKFYHTWHKGKLGTAESSSRKKTECISMLIYQTLLYENTLSSLTVVLNINKIFVITIC